MAKVWLDTGALLGAQPARTPAAEEVDCIRSALARSSDEVQFCCCDDAGFRVADASAVRDALATLGVAAVPPPAPVGTGAPARGLRARTRQFITSLPPSLQPPAMAFARAAKRIVDGPAPPLPIAPGPAREPVLGAADVFVSFAPRWAGEGWERLRVARERLGYRVLLPLGTASPAGLTSLETWAATRVGAGADGARILRIATAMTLQGATSFEDRLQHLYTGLLREGDACIDIGAHTGRHALPMSCGVGSGSVAAFEPNPTVAGWLRARLTGLAADNVTVYEMALSDESGDAEFVVAVDLPEESGLKERVYNGPTRVERVLVRLQRLDDMALGEPRFIKLDTEGAEYKVLLGARETVARARPVIAFEFGLKSYGAYGVDPNDVFAYFESLDYVVFSIYGERLEQAAFADASRVQAYWDYVACPRAQSDAVAEILRSFG